MENNVITCTDNNGFELTLTNDKIYVKSISSQETFALRSINGVGIYDDLEGYKIANDIYDKKLGESTMRILAFLVLGILFLVYGALDSFTFSIVIGVISILISGAIFFAGTTHEKPELQSYFKVMFTGGNREFSFNKLKANSVQIAQIINKIEETLTSYR